MILRSGLVEKSEHISLADFQDHWLNKHGPLAMALPGLRTYSQNHIIAAVDGAGSADMHSINGISQLYYDDFPSMDRACASIENQRCIEDIRSYFSNVTVLILSPSVIASGSPAKAGSQKAIMLISGTESQGADYKSGMARFLETNAPSARYVHNEVIDKNYIVDASVPHAQHGIIGMAEFFLPGDTDDALLGSIAAAGERHCRVLKTLLMKEHRLIHADLAA